MTSVKEWETFPEDMRCRLTTFWKWKFFMFRESISWDHSSRHSTIDTFWWLLAMCQSG